MNMSQAKSMMFLMGTFTGFYLAKRLSLTTRCHMSTFLALVTLLLVYQLMVLHHSNVAKAQLGLLSFLTTISLQKHDSRRAISLVWVLFLAIKNLWIWIHLHGLHWSNCYVFR